jgi:hypothetical protein
MRWRFNTQIIYYTDMYTHIQVAYKRQNDSPSQKHVLNHHRKEEPASTTSNSDKRCACHWSYLRLRSVYAYSIPPCMHFKKPNVLHMQCLRVCISDTYVYAYAIPTCMNIKYLRVCVCNIGIFKNKITIVHASAKASKLVHGY